MDVAEQVARRIGRGTEESRSRRTSNWNEKKDGAVCNAERKIKVNAPIMLTSLSGLLGLSPKH